MFLSDRFVKGYCPKCRSPDQYGDTCEICGAIYNSYDLVDPISTISGSIPIIRESKHLFFNLPAFKDTLYNWIQSGTLQKQVINKMKEWFNSGLQQWNISRDAPYFGFKIPDIPGKYFYVWLDAPVGYMSSFKNLCKKKKDIDFYDFWKINSKIDLYHFIGKDIIYFHSLFWPAILEGSQFRKPTKLFVHGYLTVNGLKMSKSRGTFIKASTYLSYLDPDCLRYYYATKLSSRIDDIDLNLKDFVIKINTDIVNKIINLASRSASFINKQFNGRLSNIILDQNLYSIFTDASYIIGKNFEERESNKVIRKIISLANYANRYIDKQAPWIIAKQIKREQELQDVCTMGIQLFRILMIYLKPILPSLAERVEMFLNTSLTWESIMTPLSKQHYINPFTILFNRINIKQIEKMLKSSNLE